MDFQPATPHPSIYQAVRKTYLANPAARSVVRQFGLVALGVKPASLNVFYLDASRKPYFGSSNSLWYPEPFLNIMARHGLKISSGLTARNNYLIAAALDLDTAQQVREVYELTEMASSHRSTDIQIDESHIYELGALFGYPRSGTESLLGYRGQAHRELVLAKLAPEDRPFMECSIAGDPEGLAEGLEYFRALGRVFRETYDVPTTLEATSALCQIAARQTVQPRPLTSLGMAANMSGNS
jgi:hypothetical protein